MELNSTILRVMQEERQAFDNERFRSMEKHARCALLPSPEMLDISTVSTDSPGSDETDTLRDFELIKDWVTKAKLLNSGFYGTTGEPLKRIRKCAFGSLIQLAFSVAFSAMRNTTAPELPELVFWYYAGHGLGKENAAKLCYSSTPCFGELLDTNSNYNDTANDFVKEGRKVKGGELCLHEVGFCDLYGLLKPWIAAVKSKSINAEGKKKNKHLVITLDSCHSGIIAQELNDFKSQTEEKDPTLLGENSVTIQAACGPNERTFGGYFTPCFVYLNDPKNEKLLSDLKVKWEEMSEESRNWYRSMNLPSPMVMTTRDRSEGATMELTVQNFKLTLFPDPGFFKFCSINVFRDQQMMSLKDRVLNPVAATTFMNSSSFNVLDHKLKTYSTAGPYAETPMGLFLLEDSNNPGFAVCAHIHFQSGNTNSVQRINLVHHKKPPMGSIEFYIEDHDGLSSAQISAHNQHKIPVTIDANALRLIQTCRDYVNSEEPRRWEDVSRWNMKGGKKGVNGKFRQQERSAWEDSYLEYIKQFNLPTVASTDEQPI